MRVICDCFSKSGCDSDNPHLQTVQKTYEFLYSKGILKDISFEFRDYSDCVYFAFDTADLDRRWFEIMRDQSSYLPEGMHFLMHHPIRPCSASGCISLIKPMITYRSNNGVTSPSRENFLVADLTNEFVNAIKQIRSKAGTIYAIKYLFEVSGFDPSDL